MNERIRTFMEGYFDITVDSHGREECTADYINVQKFANLIIMECAELIVKECLDCIESDDSYDYESYDEWLRGHTAGLRKAKELIVNHFEVEE